MILFIADDLVYMMTEENKEKLVAELLLQQEKNIFYARYA